MQTDTSRYVYHVIAQIFAIKLSIFLVFSIIDGSHGWLGITKATWISQWVIGEERGYDCWSFFQNRALGIHSGSRMAQRMKQLLMYKSSLATQCVVIYVFYFCHRELAELMLKWCLGWQPKWIMTPRLKSSCWSITTLESALKIPQ